MFVGSRILAKTFPDYENTHVEDASLVFTILLSVLTTVKYCHDLENDTTRQNATIVPPNTIGSTYVTDNIDARQLGFIHNVLRLISSLSINDLNTLQNSENPTLTDGQRAILSNFIENLTPESRGYILDSDLFETVNNTIANLTRNMTEYVHITTSSSPSNPSYNEGHNMMSL